MMFSTRPALQQQQVIMARLNHEVQQIEAVGRQQASVSPLSTGCPAMDACLPTGGYQPGSVVEYLRTTSGCGATYLALTAAAAAWRAATEKYLVIIDTHQQIYPPAMLSHQIALAQVIWVRPETQADAVWATDQALRTPAVAAVIADLDHLEERDARRLQLATEKGGGLGILLRSLTAKRQPSWADVQWIVRSLVPSQISAGRSTKLSSGLPEMISEQPLRRLQVQLARVRAGRPGAKLLLDIDRNRGTLELVTDQKHNHERVTTPSITNDQPDSIHGERVATGEQTSALRLAAQLAHSADTSRRAATG